MAKKSYMLMNLWNEEVNTKTKWVVQVPTKGMKQGMPIRKKKYDPETKKHHWFSSKRMPSHAKN